MPNSREHRPADADSGLPGDRVGDAWGKLAVCDIGISYGEMSFSEHNLFRNHHAVWALDALEEVRVGVEERKDSEGVVTVWHFVVVKPGPDKPRLGFGHRDKPYLDWIVTCIVDHLDRKTLLVPICGVDWIRTK